MKSVVWCWFCPYLEFVSTISLLEYKEAFPHLDGMQKRYD